MAQANYDNSHVLHQRESHPNQRFTNGGNSTSWVQCQAHAKMFYSTKEIDQTLWEFQRILPVLIKKNNEQRPPTPSQDSELPQTLERFIMLGPVGPKCKRAIEQYGEDDGEKHACGLSQMQHQGIT